MVDQDEQINAQHPTFAQAYAIEACALQAASNMHDPSCNEGLTVYLRAAMTGHKQSSIHSKTSARENNA